MLKLIRPYKDDCKHLRLDANETVFLARQLEYVKPQIYDVLYVELSAFAMFPIATDAGPGAKTITNRIRDSVGKAKIIANFADDLPRVGTIRREFSTDVRSIGASYGWSLQDIRSAMMAGVNLPADDAIAAVRAHNQEINRIAWFGDAEYGLGGFASNTDIPKAAALNGNWADATGEEIVEDVNELLVSIIKNSKGTERANVVAVPSTEFAIISSKRASSTAPNDTTVLTFLRANWPGVEFTSAEELSASIAAENDSEWDSSDDAMIAMRRDPTKLTLEIPQGYEEMPVEREGLAFQVATHSRCGGLVVRYPKSAAIRTGIQAAS